MKKILLSLAAVSALAIGAPVAAQYPDSGYQGQTGGYANGNMSLRIQQLQTRLQAGVQNGAISRDEAIPLRQQLRQLTRLERQYNRNGLTEQERSDLRQRLRALRQDIRAADQGSRQYADDGWENEDRYSQSGGYDRMDRNNDGYDDRDYDRDGRWDDDAGNGRYQEPAQRSGVGGMIDTLLGTGGLRAGQRASGNLYALPSEYRNQYRDGNGVYYRADGRQIYQIDARTQTVVRVYQMNR